MSEQHYSEKELKAMADQLLAEDAKKQAEEKKKGKQLDEKGIAALPAAQLINAHEKLKELFVQGREKGQARRERAVRRARRDGSRQRADGPHLRLA